MLRSYFEDLGFKADSISPPALPNKNSTKSKRTLHYSRSRYLSRQNSVTSLVGIEISLSTMFTDISNISELLNTALTINGSKVVPVLVADRLNRFNEFSFSDRSLQTGAADRRAMRDGENLRTFLNQTILQSFSASDADRIKILRWDDVHTKEYNHLISILNFELKYNQDFNKDIVKCAEEFFKKRAFLGKNLNIERLDSLIHYIIWELPLILKGFSWNGNHFDTALHPTKKSKDPTQLEQLVLKINTKPEYQRLRSDLVLPQNRTWVDVLAVDEAELKK